MLLLFDVRTHPFGMHATQTLSKTSDAKAFKIISHVWAPKDAATLDAFYNAVTAKLVEHKKAKEQERRKSMASPQLAVVNTMTAASWMTA